MTSTAAQQVVETDCTVIPAIAARKDYFATLAMQHINKHTQVIWDIYQINISLGLQHFNGSDRKAIHRARKVIQRWIDFANG